MMNKVERAICAQLGISPAVLRVAQRARRLGISINAAAKTGYGHDAAQEWREKARASGELPRPEDDSVSASSMISEAIDAAEAYLADPDQLAHLIAAIGYMLEAGDRAVPGYAERHADDESDDVDAGDDGATWADAVESLRSPFMTQSRSEPGSRTVRVVENGSARIERLTAREVAICAQLRTSFEAYAEARARRRVAMG
jgi:hypothetical protein